MTRMDFLKKYAPRFFAGLALVTLIVYTMYHAFGLSSGSLLTTPARRVTDPRTVSGTAYLFRDENVLSVPGKGVIDPLAVSGEKIGKNVAVADVWSGTDPSALETAQVELDRLNRMIAVLKASELPLGTTLSKASGYRAAAASAALSIRFAIERGDYLSIPATEDTMLTELDRFHALTAGTAEAEAMMTLLSARKDTLLTGTRTTVSNTAESGYYYDRTFVDGREALFTSSAALALTADSFAELAREAQAEAPAGEGFTVGKIAYGYSWYLAMEAEAGTFAEGDACDVTFSEDGGRTLTMTCDRLIAGNSGRQIAVLRSDDVPSDFGFARVQAVRITTGSTTGLFVPDSAFRVENGAEGVFVFEDSTVRFRKITVLYRGDGYRVVSEEESQLSLNDMMVTSGDRLYDGKVY